MNFIQPGYIGFGKAMFVILTLMCAVASAWTIYFREKYVVTVSQPMLLLLVIFGCFVSSLSIMFLIPQTAYRYLQHVNTQFPLIPPPSNGSFDQEYDPISSSNQEISTVDASCMAAPWLYGTFTFVIG
jgi:hypothetical protein